MKCVSTMKQDNYTNQDGCHNCTKCVSFYDSGVGYVYVCSLTEKQPKDIDFKWSEYFEIYENWIENNRVKPWGICGNFKKSKIKE